MHTLAEGKSRDYWTGRAVEPPAGLGMTHRELVNLLEKEKDAHRSCQQSLNEALSTMKDMQSNNNRQQLLGADSVGSGRLQPQDWQELRGLRAQTLDQADQIQVRYLRLSFTHSLILCCLSYDLSYYSYYSTEYFICIIYSTDVTG